MFSKEEFLEWKSQAVTKELYRSISADIEDVKELLASQAGVDPLADRFSVGGIEALKSVLEWQPMIEKEEDGD